MFAGPFLIEADAELMFTLQVQPASTGSLTFALTGTSAAANVVGSQAALTVIAKPTPTPTPPAQLAATGVEAMPLQLLGAAAVMLVLGAGTLAARRRHAAS